MRSKRYFAEDLRSAVLKVRHELGPNAVILAHQRIQSGIEVTAVKSDELPAYQNAWQTDINEETLGVKNVRDSFDDSIQDNIQYYGSYDNSAVEAGNDSSLSSRVENEAAIEVDDVANRDNSVSAGDTLMHDKTIKKSLRDNPNKKTSSKKTKEAFDYDFEAEMNQILNTHYVSLNSNQLLKEDQPTKTKTISQKSVKTSVAKPKKQSIKRKREQSKVHTALSKLKFNSEVNQPEEKQTVIRSSRTIAQAEPAKESLPPVLNNSYDHDEIVDSIEIQMGEYAFGETARANPVRASLVRQLMKLDLSPFIIQRVVNMLVSDKIDQKMLLPQAMAVIANQIPIYKEDITSIGGTIALFGATGVGKTTTIAKLAARYALKHGSENVALISTDNNRVAATEQLRTYSNILGMPLRIARNDIEVLNALNTFSEKEFVLIDTAGMSPNELKKSKFYDLFSGGITQIKKFQVLPATMQRNALEKTTGKFCELGLHGSIISKVDETTSLGGVISVAIQNHLPVAFYGNGQTVPDDFHLARAHILMSRVAEVAAQFDTQESDELNENITSGIANNVSF